MNSAAGDTLLKGLVDGLDQLLGPRLSVLIFHRVTPEPDPLFPYEMHARRFDALLRRVSAAFRVMTVGEAHAALSNGSLPRRALAITFDDGYADNAEVALPILQRHGLKATFFVATHFLDGGRMWNDTVIEAIRLSTRPQIDLQQLGLGSFELGSTEKRRRAIDAVLPRIKYMSLSQRETALSLVLESCGQPTLPADLMMRSEHVRQLHAAGMEIGGHTARHPILTEVSDDEARNEIVEGREALQRLIGAPVDVFAYPNGRPGRDYDARHVAIVRELGFRCAVSTAPGFVGTRHDAFQWPRGTPWQIAPLPWTVAFLGLRYGRPS